MNYLQGVRTGKVSNGGAYRNRIVGDRRISPTRHRNVRPPAPHLRRGQMVLWLLHAFNATSGCQAVRPQASRSVELHHHGHVANPNYSHSYLNDGEAGCLGQATVGARTSWWAAWAAPAEGISTRSLSPRPPPSAPAALLWETTADSGLGPDPQQAAHRPAQRHRRLGGDRQLQHQRKAQPGTSSASCRGAHQIAGAGSATQRPVLAGRLRQGR